MTDVLTTEQRHLNMKNIKGRNTKPELLIRQGLHRRGLRFRLNNSNLPGKPDLILPRHGVVVFIHGCFWHGHDCPMFHLPETRREFWRNKIESTKIRDLKVHSELLVLDWRILTVWECSMRGKNRMPPDSLIDSCVDFIHSQARTQVLTGQHYLGLNSNPETHEKYEDDLSRF